MQISRRAFIKKVGTAIGVAGLHGYLTIAEADQSTEKKMPAESQVGVEWLGHGSFLFVSCDGKIILLDPWLSTNPNCPGKYRKKNGFEKVDMVLWTHGHVDHFMLDDAKMLVADYRPKIVAPWELNFFIKSEIPGANCQTFVLGNKGCSADIDGIKLTMVEANHSAGAQLNGFEGQNRFVGEAVGYIIEFENGLKIYHSGDTALMGDMKTIIGDYYRPDIAILPIGGVFTMGPAEAAFACTLIRPKIVIPEHYGTFPVLTKTPDDFRNQVQHLAPQVKIIAAQPGRRFNV
jgi:L-ascorbate metabolism protein UlaG (beta-lactamase superfamily)